MPSPYDILSIRVADCETCGAHIGELCRNGNGHESQGVHFRRRNALQYWKTHGHRKEYKDAMAELKLGPEYGLSGC